MGNVYSIAGDRIKRLFALAGVNYSAKTYANFRTFLETYTKIRDDLLYLSEAGGYDSLKDEASDLFKAMISSEKISGELACEFLTGFLRSGRLNELVTYSLGKMHEFEPEGELFEYIMKRLYIDKDIVSNKELEIELKYSHRAYQRKKEQAVMLFGVTFWKMILDEWDDSIREMLALELSAGRSGDLARSRQKAEEAEGV